MNRTPKKELDRRIGSLQGRMAAAGIDAALIIQNADLFYFCGTVPQGYLLVPASGEPLLFARKNPDRVRQESPLETIIPLESPRDLPRLMADHGHGRLKKLGLELDVLPANQYLRLLNGLKPQEVADVSPVVQRVRAVKSTHELRIMRKAGALSDFMIGIARDSLKEGITEVELSGRVEMAARAKGHQGYIRMRAFNQEIYWGALVSGPDSAETSFIDFAEGGKGPSLAYPGNAGLRKIGRHEPVLFDLVAVVEGYNSDQSRTLSIGALPDQLKRAYDVSLEILRALEKMIAPGVLTGELYAEAERIAESRGLLGHFMGYGKQKAGFCGHGVGLELDELPVIIRGGQVGLEPGMVLALEPKFTFPGYGVVGAEDNYAVTETGFEKLTGAGYDVEVHG
jgi:Xaa-Pro aminopeptidase